MGWHPWKDLIPPPGPGWRCCSEARQRRAAAPFPLGYRSPPLTEAYFRTRARGGEFSVVVNDVFEDAPDEVFEGLAEVVLAKSARSGGARRVGRAFWDHVDTKEVRERMERHYLQRQRSFVPEPEGQHWDLDDLFDEVNEEFFKGELKRPMLAWSRRPITTRWGWFSSMVMPNGLIVINRLLDDDLIPGFVLRGTMYHEMLHMVNDPKLTNGRRRVHTREFHEMERRFPELGAMRPEYRKVLNRYAKKLRAAHGRRKWTRRR
jgi:hypothetical protein